MPINSDPSFTVAANPGAVGSSRWLAPEITNPSRKGNAAPVIESKAADVFAFAMLAVEVFTSKIPFEGQKNEVVVVHISRGGRPEMPGNAQLVGLTCAMWRLLESCWQHNPNRRPTMEEVVRRWLKFVESNSDSGSVVTECVKTALVIQTPLLFCSQLSDRSREPQSARCPILETNRPQAKTEAIQLPTKPGAVRSRTKSESVLLGTGSAYVPFRTESEHVRFRTNPESAEQGAKSRAVRLRTRSPAPRFGASIFPGECRFQTLTYKCHSTYT